MATRNIPFNDLRTPRALPCNTRIQTQLAVPTPSRVVLEKIALERIAMVSVSRVGLAPYDLYTERDIKAFVTKNKTAMFVWVGNHWQLFESVGDLQSVTVKVKP
jgi:hypothetical protein